MFWELLERTIYRLPDAPPHVRKQPMQVLCVGFPRTGTESLQHALMQLGYDYTHHGWDILSEPMYAGRWAKLARKKFKVYNSNPDIYDGDCKITAAEFDEVLGHCTAVTDTAGSVFAAELIEAYPDAQIILNLRRDEDAWYKSVCKNLYDGVGSELWFLGFFCAEIFWGYHLFWRYLWANLFRVPDGDRKRGLLGNSRWIYREHNNMIRGLVPKKKLLEFSVEDGWEPLCKFLNKEIPKEPFPHTNTAVGFHARMEVLKGRWIARALRNMAITFSVVVGGGVAACHYLLMSS